MIQEIPAYETPPRPVPRPVIVENIPSELRALPQWLCWRYELRKPKNGEPRWTKPPINAMTGRYGKSNDPATWATFEAALTAYQGRRVDGIGFAFSEHDGLAGIDLDHVIDAETGEISPWALAVLKQFDSSYCEWSPSGEGLRIFCRGAALRSGKGVLLNSLEVYDHNSPRYLTVTGHRYE